MGVKKPSPEKSRFMIREIQEVDLKSGFFDALSNLTVVGRISDDTERAKKILERMKRFSPAYKIFVAIGGDDGQVIGATTLLVEQKFIHDGGKVGHIEDVVARKGYEGTGVGSALIRAALEAAKEMECYKVILNCSEKNVSFYEKIGFRKHETGMRYDLT